MSLALATKGIIAGLPGATGSGPGRERIVQRGGQVIIYKYKERKKPKLSLRTPTKTESTRRLKPKPKPILTIGDAKVVDRNGKPKVKVYEE